MIDHDANGTPVTRTVGGSAPAPESGTPPVPGPMQASRPGPERSAPDPARPRPPGPENPRLRGATPPRKDPEEEDPARRFMNLVRRPWIIVLVVLLVVNWLVTPYVVPEAQSNRIEVPYSMFLDEVTKGNVREVTTQGEMIQGDFKAVVTYPQATGAKTSDTFQTRVPGFVGEKLGEFLYSNNVLISAKSLQTGRSMWIQVLLSFGPALLFFGLLMWMSARAQQAQRGIFGIGRSRARRYDETNQAAPGSPLPMSRASTRRRPNSRRSSISSRTRRSTSAWVAAFPRVSF